MTSDWEIVDGPRVSETEVTLRVAIKGTVTQFSSQGPGHLTQSDLSGTRLGSWTYRSGIWSAVESDDRGKGERAAAPPNLNSRLSQIHERMLPAIETLRLNPPGSEATLLS